MNSFTTSEAVVKAGQRREEKWRRGRWVSLEGHGWCRDRAWGIGLRQEEGMGRGLFSRIKVKRGRRASCGEEVGKSGTAVVVEIGVSAAMLRQGR